MRRFGVWFVLLAGSVAGQSAPEWLRSAEMATCWDRKGTALNGERLKGIPFLINVTEKAWANEAHRKGFRALIYTSCMDTFVDPGEQALKMTVGRIPFRTDTANALLVDKEGRFVDTLMDGTYRLHRKLICANSTTYREKMIEHLRSLLVDRGMDGLFVDNASERRVECFGNGRRIGYSNHYKTVLAQSAGGFEDPRLGDVPVHTHAFPDQSHAYAFRQLLTEIRSMVKSHGPDKVMIINGGLGMADTADGTMIESYVCSWAWKGRRRSWEQLKATARDYAPYIQRGGTVIALSYLGETKTTVKDDAYFCFAAARLSDFIWSDYQTLGDNPATVLYRTHLGSATTPLSTVSDIDYRWYRDGLVAINGTDQDVTVTIPAPAGWPLRALLDVYEGRSIAASANGIAISVPAQSGRIYQTTK